MEKQTVRIEIARPEGEEGHMHIKVEKILNGYIVRVLLPSFEEYDKPLFLPTAGLVQTHSRAVMGDWIKGERIDTEDDDALSVSAQTVFRERTEFSDRCETAREIIAKARGQRPPDRGESIAYLLANNMPNLSVLEIQTVMAAIGEE